MRDRFEGRGANPPPIREQPKKIPSWVGLRCSAGGDKVQNALWWAYSLPDIKNVNKDVVMFVKNNLHLGTPEDIADAIIKIG